MPSQITPKQARFVAEYLVDCNGARAAVAAGYGRAGARVAAHRLLTNANVLAAIAARQAEDSQRLDLTRQDAIRGLLGAVEVAREQRNPAAMIAGWKTLGTMLGFMEPKRIAVDMTAVADVELRRLEQLSDAELMTIVARS